MRAFKWSWAVPERSGGVPGGSRARIIDFSLVLGGFWGGEAMGAHGRAMPAGSGSDPLNSKKTPNTPGARAMDKHQHKGQGKHKHKGMG